MKKKKYVKPETEHLTVEMEAGICAGTGSVVFKGEKTEVKAAAHETGFDSEATDVDVTTSEWQ